MTIESVEALLAEADHSSRDVVQLATRQGLEVAQAQVGVELGVQGPLTGGQWDAFFGAPLSNGEISRSGLVPIDEMVLMTRRDGQARALYRLLILPMLASLKGAEWVAPEDIKGGGEQEVEFANQMFQLPPQSGGMSITLPKLLRMVLLAVKDGFSTFEEVRVVPDDGPLKGKITLRKLAYRDSRTIKFKVDDQGGYNGFQQRTSLNGKSIDVWIKPDKSWYYAVNEEENPFYGVSMFEAAHTHYDIKRKLYYIAHLAAQFAAIPARVGKLPPNPNKRELDQFKAALQSFALNTAMTSPAGYEVELMNSGNQFNFLQLIDHHNQMMSKSVLASFIDNEQRPALVDIQQSDPQADMFVLTLEAMLNEIAASWTMHLMPKYIDWNFGTKIYPVFKFGPLSDDAKNAIKEVFTTVITASTLNCTPEFVRETEQKLAERLGYDIDYEAVDKMEKEAAENAQEEAQQQAEQAAAMPPQIPGAPVAPGAPKPGPPKPGVPPQPGAPQGPPGTPRLVAASRSEDIDALVGLAQNLLTRHVEEDLLAPQDDDVVDPDE